jgi:replication factor C subunit 3/5
MFFFKFVFRNPMWSAIDQPQTLDECQTLPPYIKILLQSYLEDPYQLPNLLISGLSGSSKKTIVYAFLQELEGKKQNIQPEKLKDTEIHVLKSSIHMELNAYAIVGLANQDLLYAIIDEIGTRSQAGKFRFFIIWIKDAHYLTHVGQKQIGVLMEKNVKNIRFIFTTSKTACLLPSLRSRCFQIRLPQPTKGQIISILEQIVVDRHINLVSALIPKVADFSQRNLKMAINILQSSHASGKLFIPEWRNDIFITCGRLMKCPSTEAIQILRDKIEEMLTRYGIPGSVLIKELMNRFLKYPSLSDDKKHHILNRAQLFEHRLCLGHTPLIHLEAFICSVAFIFELPTAYKPIVMETPVSETKNSSDENLELDPEMDVQQFLDSYLGIHV